MPHLPTDWEATRTALQHYAHAITAHPRAALEDRRWSHVALDPVAVDGAVVFRSAAIDLADGSRLVSELDSSRHTVTVSAGDDHEAFDLAAGPAPFEIGDTIDRMARSHGSTIDVDRDRFSETHSQEYDPVAAAAWGTNTAWVVETLTAANDQIDGEVAGPHLWPHGFDVATEWFSERVVDDDGSNAQIAAGLYPAGDAYFYVNPWPFDEAWTDVGLPGSATWNTGDWNGAKLSASALDGGNDRQTVIDLIDHVHSVTRSSLT